MSHAHSLRHLADKTIDTSLDLVRMATLELMTVASRGGIRKGIHGEPIFVDDSDIRSQILLGAVETLSEAPYYSVTDEMLEIVALGADQLQAEVDPDDPLTAPALDLAWLPTPSGFVVFESPVLLTSEEMVDSITGDMIGMRPPVRAAMWDETYYTDEEGTRTEGISLALWSDFTPEADFYWQKWEAGKHSRTTMQMFFIALWSLMSEVTPAPEAPSRKATKRAERAKATTPAVKEGVRIVSLRKQRHRHPTSEGHTPLAIDHDHRWVVSGHWREQPYGPKNSLRRRIWINPFIKGPADKPLKISRTVRVLNR